MSEINYFDQPNDNDAQRVILYNLMTNKEYYSNAVSFLEDSLFDAPRNKIFGAIKELRAKYDVIKYDDLYATVSMMNDNRLKQEVKLLETLKFDNSTQVLLDLTVDWAKKVVWQQAMDCGVDNKRQQAEQLIAKYHRITLDKGLGIAFDDTSILDYYRQDREGIKTQHASINERIGSGFLKGTLSVVLASAGVGKSLFLADLASGFVRQGLNTLIVTLEMSEFETMKRVHSNVLDIPMGDLEPHRFGRIEDEFKRRLDTSNVAKLHVKEYPTGSFSPQELEALVERFKVQSDIEFDVVLVDYLGIMKSGLISPSAGLYSYVKSIAEELRATSSRLGIPVITANQLNRSAVNSLDVDNSAVSDSMGVTMTADFMIVLMQNDELKSNSKIRCRVTKNRFTGKTGDFGMLIDYNHMRFIDEDGLETFNVTDSGISKTVTDRASTTYDNRSKFPDVGGYVGSSFSSVDKNDISEDWGGIDDLESEPEDKSHKPLLEAVTEEETEKETLKTDKEILAEVFRDEPEPPLYPKRTEPVSQDSETEPISTGDQSPTSGDVDTNSGFASLMDMF